MSIPRYPIHNKHLNTKTGKFVAKKRVMSVRVVSRDNDRWSIYHCPDCRNPIAQYKGDIVSEVPGEAPHPYPVMIQCRNIKCGRKIMFVGASKQL